MLLSYFKIFIRNLNRNKTLSTINILGLSVGLASSILILLWIADEVSYDRFHKNSNEIFRIVGDDVLIGKTSMTAGPLAGYMKDKFPEVVNATRYMPYSGSMFKYNDKLFNIENGAFADPSFLKMFSFNFLHGNSGSALSDLSHIVISESMARKFFGNENPLGKTLLVDSKNPITVSAVFRDLPVNSQLKFEFILNTEILIYLGFPLKEWSNSGFHTFIQVRENTDTQKLNKQIADIMPKQIPGYAQKLFLQPLTDIHLNTDFGNDLPGLGDRKYVNIFSAIALFLMIIACINYINLSTAGLLKRSKEIGLRKVMGSNRLHVIKQIFSESVFVVIISFILAIMFVEIFLPVFNQVSGKVLKINYSDISFIIGITALLFLVAVIAGGYPALLLSSIKPVNALKNILIRGQKGSLLRKILVVIQFSLAILLIIGTITVYHQLHYISNKKLGFDKENLIYFKAKGKFQQSYNTIKNDLLSHSSILNVTAEDRLLTNKTSATTNLYWEGKGNKDVHAEYSYVDYNYFEMLNIKFKEGRNFLKEMGTDKTAFILNEEAVNQMKLKKPVGTSLVMNSIHGKIIGVIRNTNFKSLHNKVGASIYLLLNDYSNLSFTYNGIILIKAAVGKTVDAVAAIEKEWKKSNPDLPFEYHFLDETIDKQYVKEIQTANIFSYFAAIAIFISCLGLYGLTLFITENRIKEIGVRKVLGASVASIVKMFYGDFSILIFISAVVSCPFAWYAMNSWLQNFAYHIDLSWWVFALAGVIALFIALLTISLLTIKAATANPVESLKYE